MKSFDKLIIAVMVIMLGIFAAAEIILLKSYEKGDSQYRVDINRIRQELQSGREVSADSFDAIVGIYEEDGSDGSSIYSSSNEYVILSIDDRLYRVEYDDSIDRSDNAAPLILGLAFAVAAFITLAVLLYLRMCIIKPFNDIKELPLELSKGKPVAPLKESRSRYFGQFTWGLNMLREELEHSRSRKLDRMREEKTLLLSLSHDIKTPLSAIKLYSSALSKGLYTDARKQAEAAESIGSKADEIERHVNEIIRKADDDFMSFDISISDIYLSAVIEEICSGYRDKLSGMGTVFEVEKYTDCMLVGDAGRLVEVLQNIIENAVKYGDGRSIAISFSEEEDCRLITIANSGCTLPDTELPHIFDSFWRGSNASGKQGSGLGLYICRRLMLGMGGDIFAEISGGEMRVTLVCRKA